MMRLIAPEISVTENSGSFAPMRGSSIKSDICFPLLPLRCQLRTRSNKGQEDNSMNILILGGGGREHSLAWAVKQNPKCDRLIVAPGNAGIAEIADCAAINILDGDAVATFAEENAI